MRILLSTLITLGLAHGLRAQTTAHDFIANDCAGLPHHLFADLDAGYAVVLELVMMDCEQCVTTVNGLVGEVIPNTTDPGRVKLYSIGFTNSITCEEMNAWKNANGFTHAGFAGESGQTTYYGGMGMPTVVVVGGGTLHAVYYNSMGYSSIDNPAIVQAINDALAGSIGMEERGMERVVPAPNPTTDELHFGGMWTEVRVLDLQGRELLHTSVIIGKVDVRSLLPGTYMVQVSDGNGRVGVARFEKR